MEKFTFIFDLDDTIVYNQYLHYRSEIKWLQYAIKRFFPEKQELIEIMETVTDQLFKDGFLAKSPAFYLSIYGKKKTKHMFHILDTMSKIDIENVEIANKNGLNAFSSSRFPTSLVKTFKHFSEKMGVPYTENDCQEVFRIGKLTFDVQKSLVPGAKDVLDFLRKNKQEMVLYTRGDERVQQRKLELNEIEDYFSEIHIVSLKNREVFEKIMGHHKKENLIMVGNSWRSDILPAISMGVKAIYVPKETWKYEENYTEMKFEPGKIIALQRISDIMDEIHRL